VLHVTRKKGPPSKNLPFIFKDPVIIWKLNLCSLFLLLGIRNISTVRKPRATAMSCLHSNPCYMSTVKRDHPCKFCHLIKTITLISDNLVKIELMRLVFNCRHQKYIYGTYTKRKGMHFIYSNACFIVACQPQNETTYEKLSQ
jgi:hypothetical protein